MNSFSPFNNNNNNNRGITNKIKNATVKITNATKDAADKLKNATNKVQSGIANQYKKTSNSVSQTNFFQNIKQQVGNLTNTADEFSQKNSSVSKLIFMIFVLIIFGILLRLGVYLISLFYTPSKNPIILNGMRTSNTYKEYNVNPNAADPNPILRSINEDQGTEFTWSTWVWIDNTEYGNNQPRLFFKKGKGVEAAINNAYNNDFLMNSPGLYLYDPETNTNNSNVLSVVVSLFDKDDINNDSEPYDIIPIRNAPMQKWINVIIRAQNKTIDVYVNGVLTKRKNYDRVIKQNYGNVYVGSQSNGANGYISSLRYFNHAIGNSTIQDIVHSGPNLKMDGKEYEDTQPPYLAMRWYLDNPSN